MELSSAFNSSAPSAGADTGSHGETESGGGYVSPSAPTEHEASRSASSDGGVAATLAPNALDHPSDESDAERIDPEIQAVNDAQDRRLEEQARISDENLRARQNLEDNLARRYGDNIHQLNTEIADLQRLLNETGPVRMAWLKLTRQVSQDPHRDLNLLQSTKEMQECYRDQERRAFEARLREQANTRQTEALRAELNSRSASPKPEAEGQGPLTRDRALKRIEFLEDHRAKPAAEAHLRPGGVLEEVVHSSVAARQEAEISALKEFVRVHNGAVPHPDRDPELSPNQYSDDRLELSF